MPHKDHEEGQAAPHAHGNEAANQEATPETSKPGLDQSHVHSHNHTKVDLSNSDGFISHLTQDLNNMHTTLSTMIGHLQDFKV